MKGKLSNFFDRLIEFFAALGSILGLVMMIAIVIDVIMRHFFNRPSGWVVEYSEYALLYITFLPAAWLLRQDAHVRLDLVVDNISHTKRCFLGGLTSVVGAFVFLIFAYFSLISTWDLFETGYRMATSTRAFKWPIQAAIPIGSFLVGIQFIRAALDYFKTMKSSGSPRNKEEIING